MTTAERWFWLGTDSAVLAATSAAVGEPAAVGVTLGDLLPDLRPGDSIVLQARGASAAIADTAPGHVFGAVRSLKQRRGLRVFVVLDEDDAVGVQLARFVLADGVLLWSSAQHTLDVGEWRQPSGTPRRPSVDDLLRTLAEQGSESGRESALQRLLRFEQQDDLPHRLQDDETGLFDGAYATLKLDEEWKRAHRFHQPLSLLLLDLGLLEAPTSDADRRILLADAAGVFLNECRDIDVLARFSQWVFLFLLPGTGAVGADVLARRIVGALRERLGAKVVRPAIGLATVPSAEIPDRKAFLAVAEACLRRAVASGDGGVVTSWQ